MSIRLCPGRYPAPVDFCRTKKPLELQRSADKTIVQRALQFINKNKGVKTKKTKGSSLLLTLSLPCQTENALGQIVDKKTKKPTIKCIMEKTGLGSIFGHLRAGAFVEGGVRLSLLSLS
ncbi:MAG: hypothetical protein U9N77_14860 [Thermodesulfobacteriota bacterium]|nr:hypothetical protein [Thermodesulfobacteriota bacterium]